MKLKIFVILFCVCMACLAIAQHVIIPSDSSNKIKMSVSQRHAGSDAILAIVNMNRENKPIVLQHYDDAETTILAKEMKEALLQENMQVKSVEPFSSLQPWDNPKHYNFTYQMTDSVLYIKAYPQQKR